MLASSSCPYLVRHPWCANSSRLSEPQKSNLLVRRLASTLLTFFRFSTNLCALPVRDVTRTPSPVSSRTIVTSLSNTFVRPARPHVNTCINVCSELSHVLSQKALSLTEPKSMNRNPSAIILQ